jgi:hypothetical protein
MFNEYIGKDVEVSRYGLIGISPEEMRKTGMCCGQYARYFDWV